jgi:hypothetical protein
MCSFSANFAWLSLVLARMALTPAYLRVSFASTVGEGNGVGQAGGDLV